MVQINAKVNDEIVKKFRHIIYEKDGLKKGDFKKALEEAMVDYIGKYSDSDEAKELIKRIKAEDDATD